MRTDVNYTKVIDELESLRAENAALRERVAVLERVREAAKDAVNWVDNSEWRYALYLALAAAKPAAQEGKEAT